MRMPVFGLVPPAARIVVPVDRPIADNETAIVITHQAGAIEVGAVLPDSVEVVNRTLYPMPYVLLIAPRVLVKLAAIPWARVIEALSSATGRSAILERLTQLLLGAGRQVDR